MQILRIEILNDEAVVLLQQLEKMNLLRITSTEQGKAQKSQRRWAGSLSKETTEKLLEHAKEVRNEWESDI